jgi:hypothetical protein
VPVTVSALSIFDAGSTIFLELVYTTRTGTPVTPSSGTMEIIDVTNAKVLYPTTAIAAPSGSTQEIQLPTAASAMTNPTATQTNKVVITMTLPDASLIVGDFSYQLNNPTLLTSANPLQV